MVSEKFAKAETSVWKNVVVAYSKCNAHETSWRSELASKKAKMQATIREKLASCDIDVPVLALGGGTIDPKPPSAEMTDDFEELWEFVCAAQPLDTTRIQPFEGADVKWQKIIDAKESAEAQARHTRHMLPRRRKHRQLTPLIPLRRRRRSSTLW